MSEAELASARAEIKDMLSKESRNFLFERNRKTAEHVPETRPPAPREPTDVLDGVKLPFKVDPQWVHMDKVEKEKLEWIGDIPELTADQLASGARQYQVRFGFDGGLIPLGADVPVHLGLHHHSQQQHAGYCCMRVQVRSSDACHSYTLPELALWTRSAVPQQRILALDTLAAVLKRHESTSAALNIDCRQGLER